MTYVKVTCPKCGAVQEVLDTQKSFACVSCKKIVNIYTASGQKLRSAVLCIAAIIGTLHAGYFLSYFGDVLSTGTSSNDGFEALGAIWATRLVTPYLLAIGIGAVALWIGFGMKNMWFALVGSISYCIAALVFMLYASYCVPTIILGFIGAGMQKSLNDKNVIAPESYTNIPPIQQDAPTNEDAANTYVFCHKCGNKMPKDSVFCAKCGTEIYH